MPGGIPQIYLKFGGFVAKTPVAIPQILWLGCFDFESLVFSWSRSRMGCLKFCGFVIKIPVGTRQILWLHGQDAGW